jgi:hypothetical protein
VIGVGLPEQRLEAALVRRGGGRQEEQGDEEETHPGVWNARTLPFRSCSFARQRALAVDRRYRDFPV